MTNLQAIDLLKGLEQSLDDYCELNDEGKTAFGMAINALNCSEIPNNSDTINRQQALETIRTMQTYKLFAGDDMLLIDQAEAQTELMVLPSAEPEQHLDEWCVDCKEYDKEKHSCPRWNRVIRQTLLDAQPEQQNARIFQGVIVEYPSISTYPEYKGKPYFSIKYTEDGQDFIGYGTYKPDVLSEYLKKYFMPSAQPDTTTDGSNVVKKGGNDEDRTSGDCISRQAAIEIVKRYDKSHMVLKQQPMLGAASIVIELEELPSVQPEIIRCKDCLIHGVCRFEQGLGLNGYCSQAKRRTNG